jgi:cytochrome c-type biogenesis protein
MIADVTRGLSEWWAPVLAFVAGVVSFASPCVLPLVPGYLAFVSGTDDIDPGRDEASGRDKAAADSAPAANRTAVEPAPNEAVDASRAGDPGSGDPLSAQSAPGGGVAVAVAPRPESATPRTAPVLPMLLFIAGFAIVFTTAGVLVGQAPTGWFNRALHSSMLLRISGVFVLLFGIAMILYAFRLGSPRLYAERRPFLSKVKPGPAGALPLGMAFALGWTPCIGPVLGAILAIAATQGGAVRGGGLLFLYSIGLGLPFLLIGLGVRKLVRVFDVIKRNYHWFAGISGAIMVVIGFLLVSGLWESWVTPWLNRLSNITPPL